MALRIARGLVRLWLVLSVLWIGGVATVTWLGLAVGPWDVVYERPMLNPQSSTIQARSADGVIHQFPAGTANDVIDRVLKNYAQVQATKTAVKVALIPPVFVLVLGSALGWAF